MKIADRRGGIEYVPRLKEAQRIYWTGGLNQMATPFKRLMSEWARLRIAEPRETDPAKKRALQDQLEQKWRDILNFPAEQMADEDFETLRGLEDWTVDERTTTRIRGDETARP